MRVLPRNVRNSKKISSQVMYGRHYKIIGKFIRRNITTKDTSQDDNLRKTWLGMWGKGWRRLKENIGGWRRVWWDWGPIEWQWRGAPNKLTEDFILGAFERGLGRIAVFFTK